MNILPNELLDHVYGTLHKQYMKDLAKEIQSKIIRPEVYQLSITRMMVRIDRNWKTNRDFTINDNISDLWNWQKYMQKAIHKYYIKLLGYEQYSINKIQNYEVEYLQYFNLLDELKDGMLSLDILLEESLSENIQNYGITHNFEFTHQLRMLSELSLIELHNI